jgi:hypothetical protein
MMRHFSSFVRFPEIGVVMLLTAGRMIKASLHQTVAETDVNFWKFVEVILTQSPDESSQDFGTVLWSRLVMVAQNGIPDTARIAERQIRNAKRPISL